MAFEARCQSELPKRNAFNNAVGPQALPETTSWFAGTAVEAAESASADRQSAKKMLLDASGNISFDTKVVGRLRILATAR